MPYSPMYTGQTDPPADWQLMDDEENPVNLTGCTMQNIEIRDPKSGFIKNGGTPTITDPVNGFVTYQWLSTDTNQAGTFEIWIKFLNASNKQRIFDPGPWTVIQN